VRLAWLVAVASLGCGPRPAPVAADEPPPKVARLLAPPQIDPDARGAAYLTSVALSLQPAWHQFLEDCRLRLAVTHPLNRMDLATTAQIAVGKRGELVELRVVKSGNVDFDHAIEQVVRDASPLPPPPRELWSDDDQVHLAWTFARDRRQAGPATAQLVDVELPLRTVVDRRIGEHDLARAARRILRAKPSSDRELATQRLMIASLREALDSSDTVVRRAAVEAVGRAHATELAMEVRQLLAPANDVELRLAAINTSAALGDSDAASPLLEQLHSGLREQPRLAIAATRALVTLGAAGSAKPVLARSLTTNAPNPIAVQALAFAPNPELEPRLAGWLRSANPRIRAAVCSALAGYRSGLALPLIERGLRDRDSSVRAACAQAASSDAHRDHINPALAKRIVELSRDRDAVVRANAIRALGFVQPTKLSCTSDSASEVRVACAQAIRSAPTYDVSPLIVDRDPDVRAAAWDVLATMQTSDRTTRAAAAAKDPAAQVRLAAIPAIDDDELLAHLATADDAGNVRTAALVELARKRGRAGITDLLVERLAGAAPGSGERVRTALAWLLAH
jgi:HEAT repeat protein